MNRSMIVTPELFETLDANQKLDTLFFYISAIHENLEIQEEQIEDRFCKIEKRKWWNTAMAASGGFVGGFAAVLSKGLLKV